MHMRSTRDRQHRVRLPLVPLVVAALVVGSFAPVSAQGDESGVDDNAYTGPNYGWTVEWDEDLWELTEEDNANGADFITLTTANTDDAPFAYVRLYGVEDLFADPDACAEGWAEQIAARDGTSDVEPTDEYELPAEPDDGAGAAYTFTFEDDDGDTFDDVEYVQCQFIEDDGPLLIVWLFSTTEEFEDAVPYFEDLVATIELPDDTDQDDGTTDGDATDEDDTGATDEEDGGDEGATDEEDAGTEDGDDATDDEDAGAEDGDEATDDADSEDTGEGADSGIDDGSYTSPTYGFSVEWDEDLWIADPDEELIDSGGDALDRLYLQHVEDDALFSSFYVEGRTAYDGDPADCVEAEADALSGDPELIDLEPFEDDDGDPIAGESDAGGEFGAFLGSYEDEEGEEYELIWHFECQTLEEDESVVIFTLLTIEENYVDELDLAQEIIDTLEL